MRIALSALLLAAALPTAALGQVVHGRVLDAETEAPIAAALVQVVGARGPGYGAAVTTAEGSFAIELRDPGTYQLQVGRIGYPTVRSAAIDVHPSETVEVTFRLDARAILLAPLTVEARAGAELGRDLWQRRCETPDAICLDPIQIALAEADYPSDLFDEVPGLIVDPDYGGVVRRVGSRCMLTYLNHEPDPITSHVPPARTGGVRMLFAALEARRQAGNLGLYNNPLDRRIPPEAIRGIEIYLNSEDVPKEISSGPRGWDMFPPDHLGRCGIIIIWTSDQW